jgi:hypothetical protein
MIYSISNISFPSWREISQDFFTRIGRPVREKAWFEIAHPFHPGQWSTKTHYRTWLALGSPGTFEEYLDSIGFTYPERIVFLGYEERARYQCDFVLDDWGNAVVFNREGVLEDGTYLFVLSLEGDFYVIREESFVEDGITYHYKHTSLSRGEPVLSVGEITIVNGRLREIEMSSGHYYPTKKEEARLLQFLGEKGVDVGGLFLHPIPSKHQQTNPLPSLSVSSMRNKGSKFYRRATKNAKIAEQFNLPLRSLRSLRLCGKI